MISQLANSKIPFFTEQWFCRLIYHICAHDVFSCKRVDNFRSKLEKNCLIKKVVGK